MHCVHTRIILRKTLLICTLISAAECLYTDVCGVPSGVKLHKPVSVDHDSSIRGDYGGIITYREGHVTA